MSLRARATAAIALLATPCALTLSSPAAAARAINTVPLSGGAHGTPLPAAWVGIPSIGQSLSVGDGTTVTIYSTSQVGGNVQLHDSSGNYTTPSALTWSLIPLIAPVRADKYTGPGLLSTPYPENIGGESADVTLANALWTVGNANGVGGFLVAEGNYGQGSQPMSSITCGGTGNAFQSMVNETTVYARLAAAAGKTYVVLAVELTHGESDGNSTTYATDLQTFWQCAQTDLKPITGQARSIPLIVSQQNASPGGGVYSSPISPLEQVTWCQANPSECIMSGPKYGLHYQTDFVHLLSADYRYLGEMDARALWAWYQTGAWSPLWITGESRSGNVVTLTVHVPQGPLLFDTGHTQPHQSGTYSSWAPCYGFGGWTGGVGGTVVGCTAISFPVNPSGINVTAHIQLTFASAPDTVEYANTTDSTNSSANQGGYIQGVTTGRGGGILDSYATLGPITGVAIPNRLVQQTIATP